MSGLPHPFEPVTHVTDWCEDGVATVRWCGSKYLFDDPLVLEAGETKPCPVCGMELHHDEKKKEVVEFPKLSPTEPGGQMNVREALEKLLAQDVYHCDDYDDDARLLAPIIEKAARRAYCVSWLHRDHKEKYNEELGLECFVAAMTEGP